MVEFRNMMVYYGPMKSPHDRVSHSDDRAAAENYARSHDGHILEHCWEWGSARRRTRPVLAEALRRTKESGALLIIPRFAPLARDVLFLKLLWKSEVEFVACDNEHAGRVTLPLLASLRVAESLAASSRISVALGKAKRRVRNRISLGTPGNLTLEGRRRGAAKTKKCYSTGLSEALQGLLLSLRAEGKSLRQMATILGEQGHKAIGGGSLSHTIVRRLLVRAEDIEKGREAFRAKWQKPSEP